VVYTRATRRVNVFRLTRRGRGGAAAGYDGRDAELAVLCAADTRELLDGLGIERIGFGDL
jgi:hypothetical protein